MNHWPAPSIIDRFVFEFPWPATILFGGLSLILLYHAHRSGRRAFSVVAVVFLLIAVALPVIARSVTTDRQRVLARTHELAQVTIGPLQPERLSAMLMATVTLEATEGNVVSATRDEVLQRAGRAESAYRLTGWSMSGVDAAILSDGRAQSIARVSVQIADSGFGFGVPTDWLLEWRKQADQWVVTRIVLRKVGGQDASPTILP